MSVTDSFADAVVSKRRDVLIKFKSMDQILMEQGAWFDGHGNLCVHNYRGHEQLTPSTFHYLGKMKLMKSHHSFPAWCIEREWDDLFAANMALRVIADDRTDTAYIKELARKSVIAP